mmetsp:Transcript_31797/g.31085  ORF Transcript_31797/g.31085 Transcript_31797/m.31085 type:complete len:215 (+) Transcript_31797:990-1634(+)
MGSIHGTYMKVGLEQQEILRKGQNYLVGTDIYFNIIDIQVPSGAQKDSLWEKNKKNDKYEEFFSYIAKEYISQTKIYGIDKAQFQGYLKHHNNSTILDSEVSVPYPYSMLKLEIITSGGQFSYYLFIVRNEEEADQHMQFTLGRAETCDIIISQNTISREQCRILYEKKTELVGDEKKHSYNWIIKDGTAFKESSNGTWLCLTDYRLRIFKQPS